MNNEIAVYLNASELEFLLHARDAYEQEEGPPFGTAQARIYEQTGKKLRQGLALHKEGHRGA